MGRKMMRYRALVQGAVALCMAIMVAGAAGLLIRVFLWSAGL